MQAKLLLNPSCKLQRSLGFSGSLRAHRVGEDEEEERNLGKFSEELYFCCELALPDGDSQEQCLKRPHQLKRMQTLKRKVAGLKVKQQCNLHLQQPAHTCLHCVALYHPKATE